ncbi:hypothetical protein C9I98_09295 [Photobacterium sanctipauli]|uniref:Uncharacterized protein n=1 Tax=Photobacterium sanctipauli TaxID=1342794 RepID=A0A2T3NVJ1_9GAMM|nr:hypothetical protein [Photobacterium sanctipauli]PSW20239.1 hypothetical protein C9I98_09295 [Photobacterium sanctipauli]
MEQPSKSLSQSVSYLKHCTSQLVANRVSMPSNIMNKRVNEIASIEYLELEHAEEQIVTMQKALFRALHALDANNNSEVKESLVQAIHLLNSELRIPTADDSTNKSNEPSLA